ncbi:MAG TPA: hypothetical protein VFA29_04385 [Candidatus Baltobacteraceae bacterium]|nr:hypothetical protein [Candidatus Baltobacteraceae bacterium]
MSAISPPPDVLRHWFWPAFFTAFGIYLIVQRHWATPRVASCLRIAGKGQAAACERIAAAIARRQEAEGAPAPLGVWTGVASIVLGIVAATTTVLPALLYSALCLTVAAASAAAYLRLKNSQNKRVAVLSNRDQGAVIPDYWFAIAAISCASVLVFVSQDRYALSAILVCGASTAAALIARRLTRLPALLSGADVPAEQLVDDHLRFARSAVALVYALVQPFVFCTQLPQDSPLQAAAYVWNWFPWIGFGLWMLWRMRRPRILVSA